LGQPVHLVLDIAQRGVGCAQLTIVDSQRSVLTLHLFQRLQSSPHRRDWLLQTGSSGEKRGEHLINARLKFTRRVRAKTQEVTKNGPENQQCDDARTTHRDLLIVDLALREFSHANRKSKMENRKWSAPLAICRSHLTQKFKFIQTFASSFGYGTERIFRNMDRQTSLLAQKFIETAQERAAACQNQTAIHQVGRKLGRTTLQRNAD